MTVSGLQRGDLMFWKGHVAIARDRDDLIHANAFHMAVAIEPIEERSRASARPAARSPACGGFDLVRHAVWFATGRQCSPQ